MRSKSIISIIRKYGLSSKRLSPRSRIKYEDAIKGIEGYENAELKIVNIIDNHLTPDKSISCKCQIPGCNHKIRYEYVLENKLSHERVVAGSTCVWPTLGFSELEKKDFLAYEKIIKEYHDMLEWKKDNTDVWDILIRLKDEGFSYYRAFWEEVDHCRLTDEDTEFIRKVNVDKLIKKREEERQIKLERSRMSAIEKEREKAEYSKVLSGLEKLVNKYPDNNFYKSLHATVKNGFKLSPTQIKWVKVGCNRLWYDESIKGTSKDIMDKCEDIIHPILDRCGYNSSDRDSIRRVNESVSIESGIVRLAWSLFKVRENIVL